MRANPACSALIKAANTIKEIMVLIMNSQNLKLILQKKVVQPKNYGMTLQNMLKIKTFHSGS